MTKTEKIKELKARAFDAFQQIQIAQNSYNKILQDIVNVQNAPETEEAPQGINADIG
jgi:hypothetical protein